MEILKYYSILKNTILTHLTQVSSSFSLDLVWEQILQMNLTFSIGITNLQDKFIQVLSAPSCYD